MADVNGLFWNSNNGDRRYNADSLSEWLRKFFTTGVFNGEMQVTPVSGMNINVATGYANIQGKVRFFDTETSFTVPTANSTYPRIDTVVVQADYTNRNISLVYVQGAYSGNNPEPQAPVRDTGLYQIVLAQIYVAAGATEITVANITDTRSDSDLCGWVTGTVEGVPVDQIVSQMTAQFMEFFEHMKDQLDQDAAGHLQLEIDELISSLSALVSRADILTGNFAQIEESPAAAAHSVGDFIVYNNQLYKVTAAVAVGDTLEVGTNIESTSTGAEITSLYKGLTSVNIASVTRIATTVTTGTTGNVILPYSNDGRHYIVAPISLNNTYLRAWVSQSNNQWYLTAVNPNTGATINNTSINLRYLVIVLKSV